MFILDVFKVSDNEVRFQIALNATFSVLLSTVDDRMHPADAGTLSFLYMVIRSTAHPHTQFVLIQQLCHVRVQFV